MIKNVKTKYTNTQAQAAMGTKGNTNPLYHDRYTNAEAVAAVEAAGITILEHKIGCIYFDDYSKLKVLYLSANADDDTPRAMYDVATEAAYQVPTGKVFIAGRVTHYLDFDTVCGRIGEAATSGGVISKDVLAFGVGTGFPGTNDVIGVFSAGKYVTAESSDNSKQLRTPTVLYGVEVDETPEVSIHYSIGGYQSTDYDEFKLLILPANATDSAPKTFHDTSGANYQVPANKVYIAGIVVYYLDYASNRGRIGESTSADGAISREVLNFSKGGTTVGMMDVLGTFRAAKYVTGESSSGFSLRTPTYIYGVEIDA